MASLELLELSESAASALNAAVETESVATGSQLHANSSREKRHVKPTTSEVDRQS
jgi:hypothetical protein